VVRGQVLHQDKGHAGSVSAGMPEKNASNAANPPADAPMPTMGKPAFGRTANSVPAAGPASTGASMACPALHFQVARALASGWVFPSSWSHCSSFSIKSETDRPAPAGRTGIPSRPPGKDRPATPAARQCRSCRCLPAQPAPLPTLREPRLAAQRRFYRLTTYTTRGSAAECRGVGIGGVSSGARR